MRSSSRNSHDPARVLGLAAAVALLLGSAAQAGEQSHNFVMTAYTNGKGGADLVSGHFNEADHETRYRPSFSAFDSSTNSNNRCVALALTKQLAAAHAACDKAVSDVEHERASLPSYQYWARSMENDYLAVALSNRAVLHWMSSDTEGAEADLKRAQVLSPKAGFVELNRTALEYSHTAVARVDVSSSSK
jgi:hypothetical protein